jgi:uncharacterized protein YdeI (YjbR/CyaY-like superfamily)
VKVLDTKTSPLFFPSPAAFRVWLERNHSTATELLVGYYKVETGRPSLTWSESVDQALCFGWIDGIRRSVDRESYCIRFTPRKPSSTWSAINARKVKELIKQGLMRPAGLAAFQKRKKKRSGIYSYENRPHEFPTTLEKRFRANKDAWTFFSQQSPSYRRTIVYWVVSAKKDDTQLSRLIKAIDACALGKRLF